MRNGQKRVTIEQIIGLALTGVGATWTASGTTPMGVVSVMHGHDRPDESTGRGIIPHGRHNEKTRRKDEGRGKRKTDDGEPEHCE